MRLIDADALLKKILHLYVVDKKATGANAYDLCGMLIEDAPTIEAEPVRHGEWIEDRMDIVCPECKTAFSDEIAYMKRAIDPEYPKRCPECGAKMDGGKQDG